MKHGLTVISTFLFLTITHRISAESLENNLGVVQNLQESSSFSAPECPIDMVEISGDFCPDVVQKCTNLDKTIHNVNGYVRCLQYEPTQCISKKKVSMHFCMDRYEWPNQRDSKPAVMVSWYDMKKNCEAEGKRLCEDNEWTMACEGNEMLPYPYGLSRDAHACNIDHPQMSWFDASKNPMTTKLAERLNQSVPSGTMPGCVSPYGVFDMTGNVDEWVANSSGHPYVSSLKGGHWVLGARNRCRPATLAHGPSTVYYEIGGRCCKDIQ
jgi:formylglycine-generating enzyme